MTLFNLVLRNMRRNMKSYLIYFVSMIFSIVIYYTFMSLQFNTQIAEVSGGDPYVKKAFEFSSGLLLLFVAIFMVYSNSFFTRKRKKEVGLYSLLGVRKRQVGMMLFFENLFLGIGALIIGIILGGFLSKAFLSLLVYLMNIDMQVNFEIPLEAITQTATVFFVLILFTSLQGYILIYRFKLIELFRAEQEGESVPKGSVILALFSVFLIGSAYFLAANFMNYFDVLIAFYIIGGTVLGTYILFHYFLIFYFKRARKNKRSFYNGLNMVSKGQLLYRIKGNATALATITVVSTITICAVGTAATFYFNVNDVTAQSNPYSYSYHKDGKDWNNEVEKALANAKDKNPIQLEMEVPYTVVKTEDEKKASFSLQYRTSEGIYLLGQSKYNELAKAMNRESVEVKSGEVVMADGFYDEMFHSDILNNQVSYKLGDQVKTLTLVGAKKAALSNLGKTTFVVSDADYQEAQQFGESYLIKNINVENQYKASELSANLRKVMPERKELQDFYTQYQALMETTGVMIFIGGFIGLVFMLATGSIIYFKQLTEAHSDKKYYTILHKIGATKRESKEAISKQIGFIFGGPLLLGITHSLFALNTMSAMFRMNILTPVLVSMGVYLVIYVGYYFMTVRSYSKIVLDHNKS
ncbi:ABC transporter permease [Brevibacillus laterosporus]|uniref:ABC transporter permease n=1 Tax=Brevibacillus laterosporus TaxID=1465 RepID=UPI001443B3A4|nr:FtsX-like permease family protein [Brevibacillus laterosporus]NKQ22566.1 FtsX-like permease family protein [Brevibacillus laterosporus]WNX31300.1 FtsX-like permease family protein [Brevibacillus laterosporus]